VGTRIQHESIDLGFRFQHGHQVPFSLLDADRRQHVYVIGKTGTGKSTLLCNMIVQDILAGRGVGVIDPHGDLAEAVLDAIPPWRTEDVVYFDPSDTEYPIGLNLMESASALHEHLIPSQITSIFRNLWPDFWGPRLEHVLAASCASLVSYGGQTMLGISRILVDAGYREDVIGRITDNFLRAFWRGEFDTYSRHFSTESTAPILNKVGRLVMSPILRNIVGQPKSGFDAGFMMDNKRIFIANLSKGLMGEEKSSLLGSILVSKFHLAAMARATMPEERRQDFFLYVDEFQNFTTESFASVLEEARKYRLCLTLANQHLGQLRERIRTSVLGNVGSILSFRVGSQDAHILAKEFHGDFPESVFAQLANHAVCAKLLVNREASQPFIGTTLSRNELRFGRAGVIKARSRQKYATPRERIEERLDRWMHPKAKPIREPASYRRKLSG
jgi:hypothetical protein